MGNGGPVGSLVCCVFLCLYHSPISALIHIRTKGEVGTAKHV